MIRRLYVRRALGAGRGHLIACGLALPCALGPGGIVARKREGDGATPRGCFALLGGFWRADRLARRASGQRLRPIRTTSGWCDDPASNRYNRPVTLPFADRHELLWRVDACYDMVLVLNHNQHPCVRGFGSAIFLHVAPMNGRATAGCIGLPQAALARLLPRLSSGCRVVIT